MPLVQCPDCHSDVSTQARACPRCGRPMAVQPVYPVKRSRKASPLLIGCLVVFGAIFLIAMLNAIFSSSSNTSSSSSSLQSTDTGKEDLRLRATGKLLVNKDWSDRVAVVRLCEQADISKLTTEVNARCAEAHLGAAEQYLKNGKTQDARRAFDLAV